MRGPNIGPLIDHHCHGLVTADLDVAGFEALMNEGGGAAPGSTPFDSMLGLAVRRWCAPALGLAPHASPADYLERRQALGAHEAGRRLMAEAGIDTFLVDTGYTPADLTTPGELAELAGVAPDRAREVVRLETVAADVLDSSTPAAGFADAVVDRLLAARAAGAVGAKSVAAYRVGLRLPAARPEAADLVAGLARIRPSTDGGHRVAEPAVNGWLAWTAVGLGLPLQLHVGYGDADLDLAECDPLLLTPFLRGTAALGTPVMLLHNYPFHRQAAYLAQVFDHVHVDVGLATHNTGALSSSVIRETLELAPFGRVLFSTDAFGLAELYLLGSLLFRRGLGSVLGDLVTADELTATDADRIGRLVGRENAERVYGL